MGWKLLQHLPYSSDLAPSNFHLFGLQSESLGDIKFNNDENVLQHFLRKFLQVPIKKLNSVGSSRLVEQWEHCKVMHIGHQINTTYNMTDTGKTVQLNPNREEKDLGVYIVDSLKPSLQCIKASSKAMSVMRLIKRNFKSVGSEEFKLLYKAYIRLHLEYCIVHTCLVACLKKDIECLERVQRRATKLVTQRRATELVETLRKKPQEERLTTLEKKCLRGYLIET